MPPKGLSSLVESAALRAAEERIVHSAKVNAMSMADLVAEVRRVRDDKLWAERVYDTGEGVRCVHGGWLDWLEHLADEIKRATGSAGFSAANIRLKVQLVDALEPLGYSVQQIVTMPYAMDLLRAVSLSDSEPKLRVSTGDPEEDKRRARELIASLINGDDHNPRELLDRAMSPGGIVTFYEHDGFLYAAIERDDGHFEVVRVAPMEGDVGGALRRRLKPKELPQWLTERPTLPPEN